MKPGDRIKLIDRVARSANKGMHRNNRVNWLERRGTIASISRAFVAVQWDDRRTPDHWPAAALQVTP